MSEVKVGRLESVITGIDKRLNKLEKEKNLKERIETLDKAGIELNDIFENMCNDIDERLNKIEAKFNNPLLLSKNREWGFVKLIVKLEKKFVKLEETVIREDYSDLLLLIKEMKEMLK